MFNMVVYLEIVLVIIGTMIAQTGSGTHPASYPVGTRGTLSLEVKRSGCESDYSPPSSADFKNAWSYTSTPPTRLHNVVLSQSTRTTLLLPFLLVIIRSVDL